MSADETIPGANPNAELSDAAIRALKEAAERRKAYDAAAERQAPEDGGVDGPEPTRFGDWERKGRTTDFS